MSQIVKGVVALRKGAPVELIDVVIPQPGPHDVVVRVQACGVCHTDLAYREGDVTDEFPFLLGHEAAGVVESIGSEVTHVCVGDFVVLNWRAVCGSCRACRRGRPWYCFDSKNAERPMTLDDGTELTTALGIGAFAEKTLVQERQCTKVAPDSDPTVVGLLGCGVMAGLGAAVHTGDVGLGDAVAVIGCGGVGNAAAKEIGATHTINATDTDVVQAVRDITAGYGADVVIDAVGRPETWTQAFYARDLSGTVVLVGVPSPDMHLDLPVVDFFSRGGALKSAWYGDCLPERDFPVLAELYRQGRLPLDAFVTQRISITDVEAAFDAMHSGEVLRSVVVL